MQATGQSIHTINGETTEIFKFLSIEEMEEVTQEMKDDGYDIPDKCYCFVKCLFSDDVLLFDLQKQTNYIIDGDAYFFSEV